jgi:hypothetical protein
MHNFRSTDMGPHSQLLALWAAWELVDRPSERLAHGRRPGGVPALGQPQLPNYFDLKNPSGG